jgi:predicted nucleic acid-binding protein
MKPASDRLIVDTNVFLSALMRRSTRRAMEQLSVQRALILTGHSLFEARMVAARVPKFATRIIDESLLLGLMNLADPESYSDALATARQRLIDAPPSRNGSGADAHILACAWMHEADIWSHDRDFAGAGWPSWSTANLVAAMG